MIFTNILLNKFHDFSNEKTIHLANAIEVILQTLRPRLHESFTLGEVN